jgi:signal transduction histidine kinase/CheY-like chemotaxis protein
MTEALSSDRSPDDDYRVLLVAPSQRDAAITQSQLAAIGVACVSFPDLATLGREVARGAGCVIVAEEAIVRDQTGALAVHLHGQPRWSDLPVLVISAAGRIPAQRVRSIMDVGAIQILKRPLEMAVFLNAVRAALRDRRRQYQVRDHLTEQGRQSERLKEADRRKDEFLAMLAHELRNPLAPIRNGLQILHSVEGDHTVERQTRAMMDRQVRHLARLVDDLLDVSRITRGRVDLRIERIDLNDVLSQAVEAARPAIDLRRHTLSVTGPGRPVWVEGDFTRLAQVIGNLLNNAAKYTDEGGRVDVVLCKQCAGSTAGTAELRVRDSGIGIAPDMLPRVFDLFTQVDRTLDRSQGGLGIGLTLVKQLVELHDGTVEARSDGLGRGSEFVVRLPLAADLPTTATAVGAGRADRAASARVMVVDDNVDAATSLSLLLKLAGHEVATVHHGAKALEAAQAFRPDVVVLDIGLPGMDGYAVAKALRSGPGGKQLRLIALTGYGQDEDRRRTSDSGFDYHLTKPADCGELKQLLSRPRHSALE